MYCASSGEAGQPYRLASYRTRIHQQPLTLVAGKTLTGRNLIGQSQRCLSRARKTEDYEALLLSNLEEHERLSRMINSMLFLARAEHGAHPPAMEPVSVTATIDKLLDYFSDMAKEQTVHLLNQTRENEDLTLLAAPDLLQRALANLLDNALRHCPANGTIAVSASSSATSIRLSVTNSGDAIAAEHLPRLFERFYRGHQARSHSSETGGLGLAIVQSIMALHGGRASVENSAHGVCFSLDFPPY
jgi:two-component system heavy metal sensor histidine kinase CusS